MSANAAASESAAPSVYEVCMQAKGAFNRIFGMGNGHMWNPIEVHEGTSLGQIIETIAEFLQQQCLVPFHDDEIHFLLKGSNIQIALPVRSYAGAVAYAIYFKDPNLLPESKIRRLIGWCVPSDDPGAKMPVANLIDGIVTETEKSTES